MYNSLPKKRLSSWNGVSDFINWQTYINTNTALKSSLHPKSKVSN